MTDLEERFRTGLRQAVADHPPVGPIDIDEVIARGRAGAPVPTRRTAPRWVAAAAALAVVAGLGVGAVTLRPAETLPAVPLATPSATADQAATPSGRQLDGTWLADWIRGLDDAVIGTGPGDAPWLRFESATRVVANDVCNPLHAGYELDGAEVRFGEWTVGTAGCGGSVIEAQAKKYRAALERTAKVVREGDHLRLQDAKGRDQVRFVREGSTSSVPQPTTSPDGATTPTSPAASAAGSATASAIRVRVRNDSGQDLESFRLIARDDSVVNFGPVAAGETTGYREVLTAYSQAYFGFQVAGDRHQFLPQAPDGAAADKLGPGTYTYVLSLDKENRLGLTLE
jgi:heat shock protein HslJ